MLKTYTLPNLPPQADFEDVAILKALATAHRHLGELKGCAATIPNQAVLIETLSLQEAKSSSEIERIVTTQDELFQASAFPDGQQSPAAKEVARYRNALKRGYDNLIANKGLTTNKSLISMFQLLKGRDDGFRAIPGTELRNDATGNTVYVPPQDHSEIQKAMAGLERFINQDQDSELDPLIRMAIIHHQFDSIHPFPDGNGRIGRILNVLYLTRTELLDLPILYLSRHITLSKTEYYQLLQKVRDEGAWIEWVLYMLKAVTNTSITTLGLVEGIRKLMVEYKNRIRTNLPKIYSQDLLNNLFRYPYTRIEFVQTELSITRQTAARYLEHLVAEGLITKHKSGNNNYYVNGPLVALFINTSHESQ